MRWRLTFPKGTDLDREKYWLTSRGFIYRKVDGHICEIRRGMFFDNDTMEYKELEPDLGVSLEEFFDNLRNLGVVVEEIN